MTEFFIPLKKIPRTTHQQKKINFKTKQIYEPQSLQEARALFMSLLAPFVEEKIQKPTAIQLDIMWLYQAKKKSDHGKFKTTKPDLDNHVKLLQDCMTDLGFWEDDAQIAMLNVQKRWTCEHQGIYVRINELKSSVR